LVDAVWSARLLLQDRKSTYVATHPVQNSPLLKLLDNWEMESPEPVSRLRKKEGVTSLPVEFWTCSRVEVRQYSLVLFVRSERG